ncbi:MAG: hypothetical protein MN733_19750 [Nitrososphaera sp.]|nr:hypothetical protein [Nitrososphaera sp.]
MDFSGLSFGPIPNPTNTDAYLAFADNVFVFVEAKHIRAKLSDGQRWSLERLADALYEAKNEAVLIVASHTAKKDEDVILAKAMVKKYRYRKKWLFTRSPMSVRAFIDSFLALWCDRGFRLEKFQRAYTPPVKAYRGHVRRQRI